MDLILVIDDRPERAKALSERLGIAGIDAIPCARDWKLAIRSLTSHSISLVLLRVDNNPESFDFFCFLKDLISVPIAVVGPARRTDDVIQYLECGAADYIVGNTQVTVVAAKLALLLPRARPDVLPKQTLVTVGDLTINLDTYTVKRRGEVIPLTPIEFKLLRALAENVGAACSQRSLLESVWGDGFLDCAHYLRLYIGYLRQKLEDDPARPRLLLTERGYGYRLTSPRPALTDANLAPQRPLRNVAFG